MSLVISRKRNGLVPSFAEQVFGIDNFFPTILDFDKFLASDDSFTVPEANITEDEKNFYVELAAPGLDRKDFNVEIKNGVLNISAHKEMEKNEEKKNYRRREFSYSSFVRSFSLPSEVLGDNVDAKYENGILRINLPKRVSASTKPVKQIKVN